MAAKMDVVCIYVCTCGLITMFNVHNCSFHCRALFGTICLESDSSSSIIHMESFMAIIQYSCIDVYSYSCLHPLSNERKSMFKSGDSRAV